MLLTPYYPKNPPTIPPMKAPKIGKGMRAWPTTAPTMPEPTEANEPIVIFLSYLNFLLVFAYLLVKML